MTDNKFITEEIFDNVGGKSQNNLNEILRNFTDTDFEVQTFDGSSYIDIDSMTDNLKPHEKSFSLMSRNIQSIRVRCNYTPLLFHLRNGPLTYIWLARSYIFLVYEHSVELV